MNHVTHTMSSVDICIFLSEISKFHCVKNYRYRLHFDTKFLIILTFFESLKIVLMNMVAILIMSAKMVTLGLLKIKVIENKAYDAITFVYLPCNSNHIVTKVYILYVTKVW